MNVFLAGTYVETANKEKISESLYVLESFYYIKPWQEKLIKNVKMFLLDSGAFTFFSSDKKTNWESYVDKYAEYIVNHDVNYFFELDIDNIIGHERVKELRRTLENKTKKKCIPVWHKNRGIKEYINLCEEYNYIAIGGIASGEIKQNEYPVFSKLIQEAHKRKTKVHGLGFTNLRKLPLYHFDSVDSTRWNCCRYGRLEYFDGKTMQLINRRKENKRLKGGKSRKEIMDFTFSEWIKFQKYAETHL